jgi:hypothetical protein
MAFLLPVAFSPSVYAGFWSPKAMILIALGGAGVPSLVFLVRRRSPLAVAAMLAAVVSLVAAALADQPVLSLAGLYNWGTGAAFWVSCAATLALGILLSQKGRSQVRRAVLAAAVVNAGFAIAGTLFDFYVLRLDSSGRAQGTVGNPVQLGLFLAASWALLHAGGGRSWWVRLLVGGVLAAGVQLCGSQTALLGCALVLIALFASRRWGASAVGAGALILGLAIVLALPDPPGGEVTATDRAVVSGTAAGSARFATWATAATAVGQHPLLGAGPGRFREATSPLRTPTLARAEGPDRLFVDAHNVLVELLVTTGLLGTTAFALLTVRVARGACGPEAWFAAVGFGLMLFQPLSVGITPLVFLLAGAAQPRLDSAGVGHWWSVGAASAAVLMGGMLVVGDHYLEQARLDFELRDADRAEALLGIWPEPTSQRAEIHLFRAIVRGDDRREVGAAVAARRRAALQDPSDPALWNDLAELELAYGQATSALEDFRRALRWNPWSGRALLGSVRANLMLGRPREAEAALARARRVLPARAVNRLEEQVGRAIEREPGGRSRPPDPKFSN